MAVRFSRSSVARLVMYTVRGSTETDISPSRCGLVFSSAVYKRPFSPATTRASGSLVNSAQESKAPLEEYCTWSALLRPLIKSMGRMVIRS